RWRRGLTRCSIWSRRILCIDLGGAPEHGETLLGIRGETACRTIDGFRTGLSVMKRVFGVFGGLMLLFSAASAHASTLVARVDVAAQKMVVVHYGKVLYEWPVSTARAGFATPRGEFRPQRIHKMWHSRTYDNAPMPYAVFYD